MDSTPTLATAPLRSTSLRSPSLRRAAAKVAGDGRPLIFLFNMLIILLALHSNSDYEECLSYVGTEGRCKTAIWKSSCCFVPQESNSASWRFSFGSCFEGKAVRGCQS